MTAETPPPAAFTIMLRALGSIDYKRAGAAVLAAMPIQGDVIEVALDERTVRGTVDALFVPPGCEENCVGTVFLSEG